MSVIISRKSGFTLSELLVSMLLLSMILVSLLVLFAQLIAASTKSSQVGAGLLYADRTFENALRNAAANPPAFAAVIVGEEALVLHDQDHPTRFAYRLNATRLTPAVSPGERWLLELEVHWWQDDPGSSRPARAGYGQLSSNHSRVVYIGR